MTLPSLVASTAIDWVRTTRFIISLSPWSSRSHSQEQIKATNKKITGCLLFNSNFHFFGRNFVILKTFINTGETVVRCRE